MSMVQVLNKQISNWNVLYVKLHNFHWYVSGPQFFTLHTKFQELYEEAALYIDDLAERILALQGKPTATMREYLSLASVKEPVGGENATQMVEAVIADYTTIIAELKEGIEQAQEAKDETTGDMLLGIHTALEKHVWMLRSFLA